MTIIYEMSQARRNTLHSWPQIVVPIRYTTSAVRSLHKLGSYTVEIYKVLDNLSVDVALTMICFQLVE